MPQVSGKAAPLRSDLINIPNPTSNIYLALRILSGIQPSGALPNGNYFGMMRSG
jgi:hypothetical protein